MASAKQLAPGKWRIDVYKNGMRKTFRGKSRGEVEKAERNWLNDIETYGNQLKKDNVKINTLMLEHLLINVKTSVSLGTFERYMSIYKTHFKASEYGNMNIKNATQVGTQKFLNSKKTLSSKSISLIMILLDNTFKHAIANNLIRANSMDNIKTPTSEKPKRDIEVMSIDEQKAYLSTAEQSFYKVLFITTLSTGMRLGELTALKWDDVDFTNNTISVNGSARRVTEYDDVGDTIKKSLVTGSTKTKAGKRTIPISNSLKTELLKHKLASNNSTDFVFTNTKGKQATHDSITKAHKLICQKANIRTVTFHCLRHTFATRCIEIGIDFKTVSALLGHAKASTTINLYVHSTDDSKRIAAEKISKIVSTL